MATVAGVPVSNITYIDGIDATSITNISDIPTSNIPGWPSRGTSTDFYPLAISTFTVKNTTSWNDTIYSPVGQTQFNGLQPETQHLPPGKTPEEWKNSRAYQMFNISSLAGSTVVSGRLTINVTTAYNSIAVYLGSTANSPLNPTDVNDYKLFKTPTRGNGQAYSGIEFIGFGSYTIELNSLAISDANLFSNTYTIATVSSFDMDNVDPPLGFGAYILYDSPVLTLTYI